MSAFSVESAPVPPRALLAVLALTLAACGGSSTPTDTTPNTPAAQTNDINIVQNASTMTTGAFNPNGATFHVGSGSNVVVRLVNRDVVSDGTYGGGSTATIHRIVSDNGAPGSFDTQDLAGNAVGSVTLTAPGTYSFHCMHHPNMVGTLQVAP